MPPDSHKISVIYYLFAEQVPLIGWDEPAIKVGWSRTMHSRRRALRYQHRQDLALLAWELGDRAFEQDRHAQFAAQRIDYRYEWFRPGPDLIEHIRRLRDDQLELATRIDALCAA